MTAGSCKHPISVQPPQLGQWVSSGLLPRSQSYE